VLVKEMRALGLNVELVNTEAARATEEAPKEEPERPRLPPAAAE
jgi:DNA-directed RNA polymerase subunit beta